MREHSIKVTLNAQELARLDAIRPSGTTRPAFLRSLLEEPPRDNEVATRTEALGILTRLARDGRVAAAIALERAVREEASPDDKLDEILGGAW